MDGYLSKFRLEPSHTVEDGRDITHTQHGVHPSTIQDRDIIDGVGFTDETSTTTHALAQVANTYEENMVNYTLAQVANTYEENMVNYTHPQHGSSSGPDVPFLSTTLSNLNDVLTQWHPPPNALQHHGQPAPNLSVANSYTHDSYAHAYAGPSVASGPLEQQQQRSAEVIMPGGFKFVIPVEVATVLMMSSHHRCGTCGSSV